VGRDRARAATARGRPGAAAGGRAGAAPGGADPDCFGGCLGGGRTGPAPAAPLVAPCATVHALDRKPARPCGRAGRGLMRGGQSRGVQP
jgi:hypothetical protein